MKEEFTIQQISAITGLSVHTLRYYERIGLLDPVERHPNGHRKYSRANLAWIEFLNCLRAIGMSIQQMQQYAALRSQGEQTIRERRLLLEEHHSLVNTRIQELTQNLMTLEEKIKYYKKMEVQNNNE